MPLKQSALDFSFIPDGTENKIADNNSDEVNSKTKAPIMPEDEIIDKPGSEKDTRQRKVNNSGPKKSSRGRMKLSDMNASAELVEVPEDSILFQKSYYSIGAVSEMFRVNQSLIRFWENEFSILKPKKNAKGDRFFRPEDVKNLKLIHHLLRERKYTIEGAKEFLKTSRNADKKFEMIGTLKNLKAFLIELKANL